MLSILKLESWQLIIAIVSAAVIFLAVLLAIVIVKRKKNRIEVIGAKALDDDFVNMLIEALGGINNIDSLSIEHQRLGVVVNELKNVSQAKLKELGLSAFLKGKEITILLKVEPKRVYDDIKKLKGEL